MKTGKMTYWIWLAAAGLGLAACAEETPGTGETVAVYSRAAGDAEPRAAGDGACLLFWAGLPWETARLSFTSLPEERVDYYRYAGGIAYNTGREYPADNTYLYATGYAPAEALTPSDNYRTLTVGDGYKDGLTDFLSCDGCKAHKGSLEDRFTQEVHELVFRHMTARVRFVGIRDEVMYRRIGVNNVTITMAEGHGLMVPGQFVWHGDRGVPACAYVADELALATLGTVNGGAEMIPATAAGRTLGSYYVLQEGSMAEYDPFETVSEEAGEITLTMNIEADLWYLSGDSGEPTFYTRKRWENQEVTIETTTGGVMRPGYEYVVNITFNNESIILQGLQKGWEDGGVHYLPIRPGQEGASGEQP